MRPPTLLTTLLFLATTAKALRFRDGMAPNNHDVAIEVRDINPVTPMDPTRAYVLSVLRTAIPPADRSRLLAGPNPTLAPGEDPPSWYLNLPADVKSLLPILYPISKAQGSGVSTSIAPTTAATSTGCRTTTTTITLIAAPVPSSTTKTDSTSCTTTTTTTTRTTTLTVRASSTISSESGTATDALSSPCSSTTTLTRTMTFTHTVTSSNVFSLPIPTSKPTTTSGTQNAYSTPPFPIGNATTPMGGSGTTAVPSQTSASAPEQFTNAAVVGKVDVLALVGMGVVGVLIGL